MLRNLQHHLAVKRLWVQHMADDSYRNCSSCREHEDSIVFHGVPSQVALGKRMTRFSNAVKRHVPTQEVKVGLRAGRYHIIITYEA